MGSPAIGITFLMIQLMETSDIGGIRKAIHDYALGCTACVMSRAFVWGLVILARKVATSAIHIYAKSKKRSRRIHWTQEEHFLATGQVASPYGLPINFGD